MGEKIVPVKPLSICPESLFLKKLSKKKIFFGHQSVGYNIIDGLSDIIKKSKVEQLNIKETRNIDDYKVPIFGHATVGQNKNPVSKIDAFEKIMNDGFGKKVNIAFFKFCYVDITSDTDVDELFNYYKTRMNHLIKKYPKVKFIHFTIPLRKIRRSRGITGFIKGLIGREDRHMVDNIERFNYNALLKKEYSDKVIFDLAKFESTYPDNSREGFKKGGELYYALVPQFTDDGGHLNKNGQKFVSQQFLQFFSKLLK